MADEDSIDKRRSLMEDTEDEDEIEVKDNIKDELNAT